jgi:hypothetical protein
MPIASLLQSFRSRLSDQTIHLKRPMTPLQHVNNAKAAFVLGTVDFKVQSITLNNQMIVGLLVASENPRRAKVTATSRTGELQWTHPLPAGLYSSTIGTAERGSVVLVHALAVELGGKTLNNAIIALDPLSGRTTVLGSPEPPAGFLTFVRDSLWLRTSWSSGAHAVELWTSSPTVSMISSSAAIPTTSKSAHVVLLSPNKIAVVPIDGTCWFLIDLPSGSILRQHFDSPDLARMVERAEEFYKRQWPDPAESRNPLNRTIRVVATSGADDMGNLALIGGVSDAPRISKAPGILPLITVREQGGSSPPHYVQMPRQGHHYMWPQQIAMSGHDLFLLHARSFVTWFRYTEWEIDNG